MITSLSEIAQSCIQVSLISAATLVADNVDVVALKPVERVHAEIMLPDVIPYKEIPAERHQSYVILRKDPVEELEEEVRRFVGNNNNDFTLNNPYSVVSNSPVLRRPMATRPV